MIAPHQHSPEYSTNCPQCGGIAREVPGRRYLHCEYCRSLVFPDGSPLETDGITSTGQEFPSACPCCDESLQTAEIDGHRALLCRRCYGILLQNQSFGEIIRNRRAARDHQPGQDVRPIDPAEYDRSFRCPNCRQNMETHPYYGPGNVVIDSCSRCALVWLDHGELAALERAAGRNEAPEVADVGHHSSFSSPNDEVTGRDSSLQQLLDLLF